jgi:uncharacterized repeat protein (TIGR02543 family)
VATLLALLGLVIAPQTFQPLSPAAASAATISDADNNCQISVSSATVTIDSSSASISLVGSRCVVKFLTAGSYSITMPNDALVDYLVVGGGGGGGSGGGGAGGVLQGTNYQVTSENTYSISVGAGGNGGSSQGYSGRNSTAGGSSVFDSITALGGGAGGQSNQKAGNGGSGGGARYDCTNTASCAGTGTPGQGTNGAASTYPSYGGGAGGGGAGGAGANTVLSHIGGKGGDGVISSITGTPTYFGGGGGGGINSNDNAYCGLNSPGTSNSDYYCSQSPVTTGGGDGGLGGGGRGSSWGFTGGTRGAKVNGSAGTPNTGGGGGGVDPEDTNAYDGGSGIVVLSYVSSASFRKITFDSNNGSGTTSTQSVQSAVETELETNPYKYTDFVFQGWNTKADGTGTSYSNLQGIITNSSFTLYAQWLAGVNKTVTFNANGGSGTQDTQVAGLPTTLNTNQFTKSGYTFTRWATAANGSGYSYSDKATFSFAQSTTLYAQWAVNTVSRSVSFYGNGATSGTTSSQIANSTQPLNMNGFSRTGYNFLGWSTSNSANTALYLDLQNYSFSADLSLYAIWVTQAPNTITFTGNNSTSGSMANQVASSKTLLRSNSFVRTGYTFLNWNTAANGTGVNYSSSYVYNFAQSTTLYAIWGQDFTISYSGNTETSGTAPEGQPSYVGGPALALATNTGGLAKAGFVLSGWNTAANGLGTSYALGQSKVTVGSGVTLYAQWVGASYVIIYSANNSSSGTTPVSQSYTYGLVGITLSANNGTLVRTGYTFAGWNTAANGSGTSYEPGATEVTFAQDTVLFAKWDPKQTTVTYSYNGADGANTTQTQTYSSGATGLTLPNPTRSGFNFNGWYSENTFENLVGLGGDLYSPSTESSTSTVFAKWSEYSYTVNFNSKGGSAVSDGSFITNGSVDIPFDPTLDGYGFLGWSDSDGGEAITFPYPPGVMTNITLYALWSPNSNLITFNTKGGSAIADGEFKTGGTIGSNTRLLQGTIEPAASAGLAGIELGVQASTNQDGWVRKVSFYKYAGDEGGHTAHVWSSNGALLGSQDFTAETESGWQRLTLSRPVFIPAGESFTVSVHGPTYLFAYTNFPLRNVGPLTVIEGAFIFGNESRYPEAPSFWNYLVDFDYMTASDLAPTLSGYTPAGWSATDGGEALSFPYSPAATSGITLYALWSADSHSVIFNSKGGSAVSDGSFVTEGSVSAPADPILKGHDFGGWSITDGGEALSFPYTPGVITDVTLYALWVKQVYTIDYYFDGGEAAGSLETVKYVWGDSALKLPTPTRAHFYFEGWFDEAEGGSLVGLAGVEFVPTADATIFANWTQNTLKDIGSRANIGNGTVAEGSAAQLTGSGDGSTVQAEIPSGALPDGTTVDIYLPDNSSKADSLLPDPTDVLVDVVLSWLGPDGEVPSTSPGTPVKVTIVDPSIKAGDGIFQIVDGLVQLIGRATQDGSVEVTITDAAQIVIAATPPSEPQEPTVTSGNGTATVTWAAPATSGGEEIIQYVVTASTGETCITTLLKCTFTALANGKPVTFTITAFNKVGKGLAGPRTKSVTPFDPNDDVGLPEDDGDTPPKLIDGSGKFVATNAQSLLLSWDKKNGKLIARSKGTYIGHIQAMITFVRDGKTFVCSAAFGTIKPIPAKTAAEKKKAALAIKLFTGTQFCLDKNKLDPKSTSPKGGLTKPNFAKIKTMKKTASELSKEKLALAALKGFSGTVEVQVIRYLAWPTTMVNRTGFQGKGNKIPVNIRNTKVSLN